VGARAKANELAAKHPIKTFFSKLILDMIPTEEGNWRIGAEAEEEVGRILAELPRYWTARHDILLRPNWNVDHVVVGPPGVFVLDTKFRSGDVKSSRSGIRVNGYRTQMAEQVQNQAREVSTLLRSAARMPVWVQPVLVLANDVGGRAEPDGVHVVGIGEIIEYLMSLPRELEKMVVDELGAVVRDDSTWSRIQPR
jgi:hypothetical protein